VKAIGHETGGVKSRLAKRHPCQLDCRVHAADGLYLTPPIPCPNFTCINTIKIKGKKT